MAETITQVFAPLGERLDDFEAGEIYSKSVLDFFSMMTTIRKAVNHFEETTVYDTVEIYEKRLNNILQGLQVRPFDFVKGENSRLHKVDMSEERANELIEDWKNELELYQWQLALLKSTRKPLIETTSATTTVVNELVLPANFTVEKLRQNFIGRLSEDEVALALYYFKEAEIIPPYNRTSLSYLAKPVFGRSNQNVGEGITQIHSLRNSPETLQSLRTRISQVLSLIDSDIAQAGRRL